MGGGEGRGAMLMYIMYLQNLVKMQNIHPLKLLGYRYMEAEIEYTNTSGGGGKGHDLCCI